MNSRDVGIVCPRPYWGCVKTKGITAGPTTKHTHTHKS